MDDDQLKAVVKQAVLETLRGIGFNTDNPTEIQEDIAYLRKIRRSSESVAGLIRNTAIGIVLTGLMYGFWETIKTALAK